MRPIRTILPTLLLPVFLSGCISFDSARDVVYSDLPDPHAVQQVEPGRTTTGWLLTHFGEPGAITVQRGETVWQYLRVTESSRKFRALPVVAVRLREQTRITYNFAIEEDRVTRFWFAE